MNIELDISILKQILILLVWHGVQWRIKDLANGGGFFKSGLFGSDVDFCCPVARMSGGAGAGRR